MCFSVDTQVSGGQSTGQQSESAAFSRAGSTTQQSQYSLGSALSSLLNNNIQDYGGPLDSAKPFLGRAVNMDTTLPGYSNLIDVANTSNPGTSGYEDKTAAGFDYRLGRALANSRTGMENATAPLNRGKEFRESDAIAQMMFGREDELRKAKQTDMGLLTGASGQLMGTGVQAAGVSQHSKQANAGGAAVLAELLGPKVNSAQESYTGQGNQGGTMYSFGQGYGAGAGASCCFIFLEAYNGMLPWWVRECRDEFVNPRRRSGYVRMSRWLVPAMKRSWVVRTLVNELMIRPLTLWGGFYKQVKGYESFWFLKPVVKFWFRVWDVTANQQEVK